jgi:hypothetical protein
MSIVKKVKSSIEPSYIPTALVALAVGGIVYALSHSIWRSVLGAIIGGFTSGWKFRGLRW